MTSTHDRIQAVAEFGFSERQARFLVLVIRHGGVCVPRQYARFAGVAYGAKCNAFFDRLVRRGFAHANDCIHNRARLYHVHSKALYHVIGDVWSRYRRPVSPRLAIERLMLLDAVLTTPDLEWITTAAEKAAYLARLTASACVATQQTLTTAGDSPRTVTLPGTLPIGVESHAAHRPSVPCNRGVAGRVPNVPPGACRAVPRRADLDATDHLPPPARPRLRRVADGHPRGIGIAAPPSHDRRA